MTPRKTHTIRFFRPSFSAIHCMAYSDSLAILAISRADNSIELWQFPKKDDEVKKHPFLDRWIPGNTESSVEALAWAGDRLFSTGLHGLVLEYDLEKLVTKAEFAVTSGPSWCMSYHTKSNRLAVGTEEGYVCIFAVEEHGLRQDRVLDKQEGRVLCLDWHVSGDFLVTGSPDTLRVWKVATGHPVQRMSTGRVERNRETVVWSVAVTDDLTLVSGDSRGKTCFWDGKTGTLIDAYQTHKADVLTVCVDNKGEVIFSSGVDPMVVYFQPIVRKDGRKKWVKSVHRNFHTHDVRSIVCKDASVVISGGVDSALVINDNQSKVMISVPALPQAEACKVAPQARMILLRLQNTLELWKLGEHAPEQKENVGRILSLANEPVKTLSLETKDDETIRSCDLSQDGSWLGYVSATRLRAYNVTLSESGKPTIKRANFETGQQVMELAHQFRFYKDDSEDCLITATEKGNLQVFKLNPDQVTFELTQTIKGANLGLSGAISHLEVNSKVCKAVISDRNKNVVILDLHTGKVTAKLPKYDQGQLTSLAIHPSGETLACVYSDNHLVECHVQTGKYTKFSSKFKPSKQWSRIKNPTRGIVLPPDSGEIILYDTKNICVIDKRSIHNSLPPVNKSSKKLANGDGPEVTKEFCQIRIKSKYEHLAFVGAVTSVDGKGHEMVVVEVKPSVVAEQMPPSLKQKKFGIM